MEVPEKFASLGLTYDDVLLLPGHSDLSPDDINLSAEEQAYQVDLVKRTQTGIISNPVTIGPDATLEDLDRICGEYRVSGLPVVDSDNRLLGICTNRDLRFTPVAEWATTKVDEVMTPTPLVTGPVGITRDAATLLLRQHKRERLP